MPPSLETMEDLIKQRQVTISLSDMNEEEPFSHRIFTLKSPDWSVEIGRGNSIEQGTIPGPDNAWFTSKVVSRHHATIKAHPRSMILTIEDNNSMHGTYLNGTTVKREPVELLEGDEITFGTDIVRHAETFSPLNTRITYEWVEEDSPPEAQPLPTRNSFTADYSDQDIFSDIDDDVEIVKECLRQPSVEVISAGRSAKPAVTSSSTNSPSTSSTKSAGASSATTTHVDLSVDDEAAGTKLIPNAQKSSRIVVDLEDSGSDMDDYPISPSEDFSANDVDDEEDLDSEEAVVPFPQCGQSTTFAAAAKSPREPSPSDAALPALRSVPAPKVQSVPSLASMMPSPPPPFLASATDEPYRSPISNMSHFNRSYTGMDFAPTSYQPPQPFTPSVPFGYEFTAMNPPSPLRASTFTNYSASVAPTWGYSSMHVPQPPAWTEREYSAPEDMYRPSKRKAGDISSDSEEDYDSDLEPVTLTTFEKAPVPQRAQSLSETPVLPLIKEAAVVTETAAEVADAPATVPEDNTALAVVEAGDVQEMRHAETEAVKEIVERPRKRTRLTINEPERRSSTMRVVARYAATASAGAVVGAVGVIIGLASLPPDYFL